MNFRLCGKLLVLFACTFAITIACSKDDGSTTTETSLTLLGTGDGGGGGNTCKGKPIESYKEDIFEHPAFIQFIQPLLQGLAEFQDSTVYRFLTYGIYKKPWYVMPCPLEKLGGDKINSPIDTDQGAIQRMDEIWISQEALKGIDVSDHEAYAKLIVHEFLMSLMLVKFESDWTQCVIHAPDESYCGEKNTTRSGSQEDLTDEDYATIRKAVDAFFNMKKESRLEDWSDYLAQYFQVLSHTRFAPRHERFEIHFETVLEKFEKAEITNQLPTKGFKTPWLPMGQESPETCSVELRRTSKSDEYELTLQSESRGVRKVIFQPSGTNHTLAYKSDRDQQLQVSYGVSSVRPTRKGETEEHIEFQFDAVVMDLKSIRLYELYCIEDSVINGERRCSRSEGPLDLPMYLCTLY